MRTYNCKKFMERFKKFSNKTYSSPELRIGELIKILRKKGLTNKKILDIGTQDAPYIKGLLKGLKKLVLLPR